MTDEPSGRDCCPECGGYTYRPDEGGEGKDGELIVDIIVTFPPRSSHRQLTAAFPISADESTESYAKWAFGKKFSAIMKASRGEVELEPPISTE